ncbi:MAG: c-type cytochrome domain-containing protein [Verrucomicrobiota bacterium]
MKKLIISLASISLLTSVRAADPDFVKDIAPILEASCVKCHHEGKAKGKLRMDTKEMALKGGKDTKLIVPGKPDESAMIKVLLLEATDDDAMPPDGKAPRPDAAKIELLKKWIAAGAVWPDDAKLKVPEEKK